MNSTQLAIMDWESESSSVEPSLSCPLCQRVGCFPSAGRLLCALKSLTGGPVKCGVCGQSLADLPSYLQHLAGHLSPDLRYAAGQQPPASRAPPCDQPQTLASPPPSSLSPPAGRPQTAPSQLAPTSQQQAALKCLHCPRMFKTARGRTCHMRAKHAKQSAAPSEPAGGVTANNGEMKTLAPLQSDIIGSLALLDYCLGLGSQDTLRPASDSTPQTVPSPCPHSGVQVTAANLVDGTRTPTAEQRPTLSAPTDPAGETLLPPPPAVAEVALGRRADGGRRLRRLLQASHACQDCGRVFRLRPGLAAHRRLAHGDGACEQCSVCQRRFTSVRRLQRHLATAHGLSPTVSLKSESSHLTEPEVFRSSMFSWESDLGIFLHGGTYMS